MVGAEREIWAGKYFSEPPKMSHTCALTLLHLAAENVTCGDQFGNSVLVFTDWAIVGAPNSNSEKGKAYLYKRVLGAWDDRQEIQASDGSDFDYFGQSVNVVVGALGRVNDNGPYSGAVYVFTLQGETWTEDIILTASDMTLGNEF